MFEVIRVGIGFDTVDLDAAPRKVSSCNTPDAPSISTRRAHDEPAHGGVQVHRQQCGPPAAGRQDFYAAHEGIELSDATIGVVGHGRIGSRVARMCAAMDMRAIVCDPMWRSSNTNRSIST